MNIPLRISAVKGAARSVGGESETHLDELTHLKRLEIESIHTGATLSNNAA